jgi:hypothetical protein
MKRKERENHAATQINSNLHRDAGGVMNTDYDMSTGRVIETSPPETTGVESIFTDTHCMPELGLQEISHRSREEARFPPQLAIADLNAFLHEMS